jgi:exopolyphosphatase/guanosine-5'-triphosphate,3'-diphosphate pyrophosphatase
VTVVPRWEWRTFGERFPSAEERFAALSPESVRESDELYLLSKAADDSVKVRDELLDVKHLEQVNDDGIEQWRPVLKAPFPLSAAAVDSVLAALHASSPPRGRSAYTLDELVEEVVRPSRQLAAVPVHKRRVHYTLNGRMAELTDVRTDKGSTRTIAVESEDVARVLAFVRALGLDTRSNVSFPRGLKALLGIEAHRYAPLTLARTRSSSTSENGAPTVAGRQSSTGPRSRGLEKASRRRVCSIPARWSGRSTRLQAWPTRQGVRASTRSWPSERRACGSRATLQTSSRPSGTGATSIWRSSAAKRRPGSPTSRRRLRSSSGTGRSSSSRRAAAAPSSRSEKENASTSGSASTWAPSASPNASGSPTSSQRKPLPASSTSSPPSSRGWMAVLRLPGLSSFGGAATNLAAVKHELATYDPDVVQGTVLDLAEIDRQIALYAGRTADERREIVGLQPKRAEVILAGACTVRTVIAKLARQSATVSDRGLRHGLLLDRFG